MLILKGWDLGFGLNLNTSIHLSALSFLLVNHVL